ncbi:MAG: MFS transporter [Syntrophothermus sp.]
MKISAEKDGKRFSLRRNLTALYIVKVAKWMNLIMPIVVLFYKSNCMTMQDIFILQGIYSVTLMILEIPTGWFADFAGRRTSILAGSFFGVVGYLVYSTSSGFWQFVVAETVLGVGMSLVSGADSALLYDSLASAGKDNMYTRFEGRITSIGNFGEALAGVAGGLLAAYSLRTPYYFQTGIAFLAIPAAMMLREPPVRTIITPPGARQVLNAIIGIFGKDRKLMWSIILSAVTGVSTLTMAWFAQPFFIQSGIKVSWFGAIWAILNLSVGIAAMYAWRIEDKLGSRKTILFFSAALAAGYLGLAGGWLIPGFTLLFIFYLARGLATPTLRNYINLHTTSDVRATILSVRNFIIRGLFALLGPLFGLITDRSGLSSGMLAAGVFFTLSGGIALFYFLKTKGYSK